MHYTRLTIRRYRPGGTNKTKSAAARSDPQASQIIAAGGLKAAGMNEPNGTQLAGEVQAK
ncbi:MAG: hypothetical protein ACT4ON_01045 [Bacteroidota bacterium]